MLQTLQDESMIIDLYHISYRIVKIQQIKWKTLVQKS